MTLNRYKIYMKISKEQKQKIYKTEYIQEYAGCSKQKK